MSLEIEEKFIKKSKTPIECGDYFVYDTELYIQSENYGFNLSCFKKKSNNAFVLPKERISVMITVFSYEKKELAELSIKDIFSTYDYKDILVILEKYYDEHNVLEIKALSLTTGKETHFLNTSVFSANAKIFEN